MLADLNLIVSPVSEPVSLFVPSVTIDHPVNKDAVGRFCQLALVDDIAVNTCPVDGAVAPDIDIKPA